MVEFRVVLNNRLFLVVSLALFVGTLLVLVAGKPAYGDGTLPNGFAQSRFVGGLTNPTAMAFAPDGRLFVAEQGGKLRIVKNGRLLSSPFVDLTSITDSTGERGLLGIALDPNFDTNQYVYVYQTLKGTATTKPRNRVLRFTANGDRHEAGSGKVIFYLDELEAKNHNGGAMHFGRDGKLYVAVGENGVPNNAQSTANLLGKMLRLNGNGTIPTDNPLYTNPRVMGKNKAIWALGLRNPYSFDVQPGTGKIFINDVGQKAWEEINPGGRGGNYGWPVYEGPESASRYSPPLFAYRHGSTETTGCAITGGVFYNPQTPSFPSGYVGDYFFADFCSGWIRKLDSATNQATSFKSSSDEHPVDLKVSKEGDLYFLARGTGSVEKISYGP